MSDDFDPDLKDLDVNDIRSIERWVRQARHYDLNHHREEPRPKPEPKREQLIDADASRRWAEFVDQRINAIVNQHIEEIAEAIVDETEALRREIKEKVEQKPKVIIYDPSEAMQKQIEKFAGHLREELAEIRKELNLQRKGEILDLPSLPRKRA